MTNGLGGRSGRLRLFFRTHLLVGATTSSSSKMGLGNENAGEEGLTDCSPRDEYGAPTRSVIAGTTSPRALALPIFAAIVPRGRSPRLMNAPCGRPTSAHTAGEASARCACHESRCTAAHVAARHGWSGAVEQTSPTPKFHGIVNTSPTYSNTSKRQRNFSVCQEPDGPGGYQSVERRRGRRRAAWPFPSLSPPGSGWRPQRGPSC